MYRDEETGRFVSDREPTRRATAQTFQDNSGGCPDSGAAMKTTLGLLAGAGIGAGLMYLFDPYEGPTRRANVANMAGSTWETLSERAAEAGSAIAAHLPSASELRDKGQKFVSRTGDTAQQTAGEWLESARNAMPAMPARRRPSDLSATGAALGGLGLIAVSVAATWLFDPQRGRGRRAWLAQKATRYVNETGRFMRATGRHLRNRAQGAYHDGRTAVAGMTDRSEEAGMRNCPDSITATPTSI